MDKIKNIWQRKYAYWTLGAVALVLGAIFIFNNGNGVESTLIVNRTDFINQVAISGKVETSNAADLGFAAGGRVGRIFVTENDMVQEGQILAQLEIGDLLADLKIKEINSKQENIEVESAYRKLLTEGLELVASSDSYAVDAPEVSGIYDGAEGTYKIRIIKEEV